MWGMVIAASVGVVLYFLGNATLGSAFLGGTTFLFWWYFVTSIIGLAIVGLIALGIIKSGIFGVVVGGGFGLFILALMFLLSAMRVMGAYFLYDSVAFVEGVYAWDVSKMVIGGLFVGLPLNFRVSSISTS